MKRFVFALDAVLKVKRHRARLAEMRQGQAAQALAAAQDVAGGIRRQLDLTCTYLQGRVGRPQEAATWLAVYLQSDWLEQQLQAAGLQVEKATRELERAAEVRRQAAVEVEALLALRERQWQEFRRTFQKMEQERLDEVGLRRWQAGRPGADAQGGGS